MEKVKNLSDNLLMIGFILWGVYLLISAVALLLGLDSSVWSLPPATQYVAMAALFIAQADLQNKQTKESESKNA